MMMPHPSMSAEQMRRQTQQVWDSYYGLREIWKRSSVAPHLRARLAFLFVSKLYRQMYANTGIATDSARKKRATSWARWIAKPCCKLFLARPAPNLPMPGFQPAPANSAPPAETPLTILTR